MKTLLIFTLMISLFFSVHAVLWRFFPSVQGKRTLIACAVFVFLTMSLFKVGFFEFVYIGVSYGCAIISYLIFYTWIETDSPSILMINHLSQQAQGRASVDSFQKLFSEQNPIHHRLECLLRDGFCCYENQAYVLTTKGKWFASAFIGMGRVLSIPMGG